MSTYDELSTHDQVMLEMFARAGHPEAQQALDEVRGPSDYGWIIDRDYMFEQYPDGQNDAGVSGPRRIAPEIKARLEAGEGQKFRMYDDDGELYYAGRALVIDGSWPDDCDEEAAFAPLNDFGTPNAGATEIRYQERTEAGGTKWVTL